MIEKKVIAILIGLLIIGGICGCVKQPAENSIPKEEVPQKEERARTTEFGRYHVEGEDRDFEWKGHKTIGKMWNQPLVGTLNFEITFNEDFSAREGTLKHSIIKLTLKEKRVKVTDEYVQYEGEVTGWGQHRITCHRIYRDSYVEVLSGGEEGTLERKATITPTLSEEDWARLRRYTTS